MYVSNIFMSYSLIYFITFCLQHSINWKEKEKKKKKKYVSIDKVPIYRPSTYIQFY